MSISLVGALLSSPQVGAQVSWPDIFLTDPIGGFQNPVHIAGAGDGTNRLFVVELPGRIRLVKNGTVQAAPFLDVGSLADCANGGLLSVAFPPAYAATGRFYVAYNDVGCNLVVARYRASSDPDMADPASGSVILSIQMAVPGELGHSGGQLAFGPDGFLYVSMGDGSNGGDPDNLAQDPSTLLGKLLRIDVETGDPATYSIPPSNPFAGTPGYRPEIWALGLRNPFRFSFDSATGDLYLADVGEANWEEVNFQPAGNPGGRNYGWRIMEGPDCFGAPNCNSTGLDLPAFSYPHSGVDCSISGGEVYRGSQNAQAGIYFFGDFCSGRIRGLRQAGGWQAEVLEDSSLTITGFGHDDAGELYVADFSGGTVYRLATTSQGGAPIPPGAPPPASPPGSPPTTPPGSLPGGCNLIVGTPGDDILKGTAVCDLIKGKGGDDILKGGRGDDILKGGRGDDILKGGRGADILKGGGGFDVARGGAGSDRCAAEKERSC